MSRFFSIEPDDTVPHPMVVDRDELGAFDHTRLWNCERFDAPLPPEVRLNVRNEGRARMDFVPNGLSWGIYSQRFVALLMPLAKDDIQLLDAPLYEEETGAAILGYSILNVLTCVECLDAERSVVSRRTGLLIQPVLRADRVPRGVHVFRPKESPCQIVVSEDLVRQLTGRGLRGLVAVPHRTS